VFVNEVFSCTNNLNSTFNQITTNIDGHLLIILHKPPTADDAVREGVLFWRTPDGNWKWTRGIGSAALAAHVKIEIG
jgi:hypothetical protein